MTYPVPQKPLDTSEEQDARARNEAWLRSSVYDVHTDDWSYSDRNGLLALLDAERAARKGTCEGHIEVPDEKWEDLRERYGSNPVGFVAELAKKNHERRIEHEILTAAGIPSETEQGRALCLVARLAIMAERLAQWEAYADAKTR